MNRLLAIVVATSFACGSGNGTTEPKAPEDADLPLKSITIEGPATLPVGQSVTMMAAVFDTSHRRVSNHAEVTWAVAEPNIARIDETTGNLHALSEGVVNITATIGSVVGTRLLIVDPPPPCNPNWDFC